MNKGIVLFFIGFLLHGCMPYQPLKSPCDPWDSVCGKKININQWKG